MALENLVGADKFISNLVPSNPTSGDDKREGDDHLRGVKNVLKNTFPNLNGAVPLTPAEMGSVTSKVNKAGDVMTGALQFSTGGVVGAEIKSGGNWLSFGTGAATPTEKLRIEDNGRVRISALSGDVLTLATSANTDCYLQFQRAAAGITGYVGHGANSADVELAAFGTGAVQLVTGGQARVRVESNGNVGVGVVPGANVRFDLRGPNGYLGYFRSSANGSFAAFAADDSGPYLEYGNGPQGFRIFEGATERMRFDPTGRIKFNGVYAKWESPEGAVPTTAGLFYAAHSGGRVPDQYFAVLRCKIAEHGWGVGTEIVMKNDLSVPNRELVFFADVTNVGISYAGNGAPNIRNTSGVNAIVTAANWRIVFRALWIP